MIAFDHVAITVKNLDRSLQWYQKSFGFKEIRRFEKASLAIKGATLKLGDFVLELLEPTNPFVVERRQGELSTCLGNIGANHLAFKVDDINSLYRQLLESHTQMVTEIIEDRYFFCIDPDCVLIEIKKK